MKITQFKNIIPGDWQQKSLVDICSVNQGLQIPISERFKTPGLNRKVYITNQYLAGGSEVEYIENYSNSVCCQKDDILMTRTGNTGILVTNVEGVFHNNFFKVKPKKELVKSDYLIYFLRSPKIQYKILRLAGTSTIPDLNHGDFYIIPLNLPPILEQDRIVAVLEVWDRAIEKLKRKIEVKKNVKKGLIQELLTGKTRLAGFKDQLTHVYLGDVCTIDKGDQLNKLNMMDGAVYPALNGGIGPSGYTDKWNTEANIITISEGGNSCGFVNLSTERFWCGGHCYAINPKKSVDNLFLYQVLKFKELMIMRLRVGSGLPNIQKKSLQKFKLKIPKTKEEQASIANILTKADNEISKLKNKIKILSDQKKFLLNNLITGTIRTPETLLRAVQFVSSSNK